MITNLPRRRKSAFWVLVVFVLSLHAASARMQAEEEEAESRAKPVTPKEAAAEKETDIQHLKAIYAALVEYRQDNDQFPGWLSDLYPKYISDKGVFLSPVEKRTGRSALFGRNDPKMKTSYIYDFNNAPAPEAFNNGREFPITLRQWKLMQIEHYGEVVPILSCHLHNPIIHVAHSGEVYETRQMWELDPRTLDLMKKKARERDKLVGDFKVVMFRCIDSETKQPVADVNATAYVFTEFGIFPRQNAAGGADGQCGVALPDVQLNTLSMEFLHPKYQPQRFSWERKKGAALNAMNEIPLRKSGL